MEKNWLVSLCEKYGITFYELSKRSGVAQSTLSNIKNKNISFRDVKFGTVIFISDALGMSPNQFLNFVSKVEFDL